ncbi:RNA polymerase sigma factor [Costertonia aggregata]|uniref:RNA polymerase sigma factor n=1 Tax=Costertonia aggregata TaxID=343403 RepID=A0A7H9AP11_9FLAO|nr:RNA polymerase sigma factor [Costertonia aggregata]QLG45199.1 RNA polymerase sigma factor [Costertonia aggregata]
MSAKELKFKEVYENNYPKVMRLCLGYVNGENTLARDLTQETFIKVWENLDTFRDESRITTWVYRIAVNTCLAELRQSKKNIKRYQVDGIPEIADSNLGERKEELLSQLYSCINTLTETNKAIILLELDGLPQKEIAVVTGLKHEAIRTRIHRIKNELTKCVHHE